MEFNVQYRYWEYAEWNSTYIRQNMLNDNWYIQSLCGICDVLLIVSTMYVQIIRGMNLYIYRINLLEHVEWYPTYTENIRYIRNETVLILRISGMQGSFNFCFFLWTRRPFFIFLCRPYRTTYRKVRYRTIPDGSPSKDWQSTVGWGDSPIRTPNCRLTFCCGYQAATTAPYEPPLLPKHRGSYAVKYK